MGFVLLRARAHRLLLAAALLTVLLTTTVLATLTAYSYALPGSLRPPTERSGDPDLTFFAALDPTQVRVDEGRLPEGVATRL